MKPEQSREWAALALDPARPVRRESKYSEYFVMQDGLPTRPEWRALVPFLALPDACEVKFYCSAGDLVPDQLYMIFADLDPAANRGYRSCQISPHTADSAAVWLTDADGRTVPLMTCEECGSRWGIEGDTGYGTTFNCPDCGHNWYSGRGD